MANLIPIAFFDPPKVLDTTVTPIPASSAAPLQVIADIGINTGVGIAYSDSTNQFIGVYIGLAGQETLACIVGNGVASVAWGQFPARSRVSLRAMINTAINNGSLTANVVTS